MERFNIRLQAEHSEKEVQKRMRSQAGDRRSSRKPGELARRTTLQGGWIMQARLAILSFSNRRSTLESAQQRLRRDCTLQADSWLWTTSVSCIRDGPTGSFRK